eukprot:5330201-Amphidinium_carterae.1
MSWIRQRSLHRVRFNVDAVHFARRVADNLQPGSVSREKLHSVANHLAGRAGPQLRLPGVPLISISAGMQEP